MPRGGFGHGFGRGGIGMRRMGRPLLYPMGGWGTGSPLLTTMMAGGLGYMMGSNVSQQAIPPQQIVVAAQPTPMQGMSVAPAGQTSNGDASLLAQLKLLGELHAAGYLTNEEFAREKQRLLRS